MVTCSLLLPIVPSVADCANNPSGIGFLVLEIQDPAAVVARPNFVLGSQGVGVFGIERHEAAAADVFKRGTLAVLLDVGHRVAVIPFGDAVENLHDVVRYALGGFIPLGRQVIQHAVELGDVVGIGFLRLGEAFFLVLDLHADGIRLGVQVFDFLNDLEGGLFVFGVVGLEGVDLGEDRGVFLVGLGGVQGIAVLGDFLFVLLENPLLFVSPSAPLQRFAVFRLPLLAELIDLLLLGGHGILPRPQPSTHVCEIPLDRLYTEQRFKHLSHSPASSLFKNKT